MNKKKILDVCCGSRMFWFDKGNQNAIFNDVRNEDHTLCDGRKLCINPDTMFNFGDLGFKDGSFKLVVFDPPHLLSKKCGQNGWMRKKYGSLDDTWRDDLKKGFSECFRVLEPGGVLIFKWSNIQIKTSEVLKLTKEEPLFGHRSGKRSNTHWVTFMKGGG